jgi:hypothetical protein
MMVRVHRSCRGPQSLLAGGAEPSMMTFPQTDVLARWRGRNVEMTLRPADGGMPSAMFLNRTGDLS